MFIPEYSDLPPLENQYGWFIFKSPMSFVLQPHERKIISCGYSLNCDPNDLFVVETSLELITKGILIIGSNINKRPLEPKEEIVFVFQNLNELTNPHDPLQIFGHMHKVQISVGHQLAKVKKI